MKEEHHKRARKLLYEEFRLIEKSESEVNGAWKGAHILLFFLAFVFGSFCTFCFHLLMYLFEEKCVLFPKLLSLTPSHPNVIYELIPDNNQMVPVDFVSTQWIEKSACYLPTYVPLVSGIFGLVWTTMFLMCSTGSRNLTGLQRPWRVIPPVFIFSLAMGSLCMYTSAITHRGLDELCVKLGEITGSHTCSYSINVATLLYERNIRGVYQATRLTITTAWLHTFCWIFSALLALVRVLLVVDFRLVKIDVELIGDVEQMLERDEEHLRTVSPVSTDDKTIENPGYHSDVSIEINQERFKTGSPEIAQYATIESNTLYFNERDPQISTLSLKQDEEMKLVLLKRFDRLPKTEQFIYKLLYDFIDDIDFPASVSPSSTVSIEARVSRHYEQEFLTLSENIFLGEDVVAKSLIDPEEPASTHVSQNEYDDDSLRTIRIAFESLLSLTPETRRKLKLKPEDADNQISGPHKINKSSVKQTDKIDETEEHRIVKISDSRDAIVSVSTKSSTDSKVDKETQTGKAKQD